MILYISIILLSIVILFIYLNRQSPRTNEVIILLIIYAFTLLSFYLSDINKRKTEIEKKSTYSNYVAYSKKEQHIKEIPLMRFYATTGGTAVYSESLPAFLLRNSSNPDHTLDTKKPFKNMNFPHFLRDFMEMKIINILVWSSRNYLQPEPHASAVRFSTNVAADEDLLKVIKSSKRITFDQLSDKLQENQLYQSFLTDNKLKPWLVSHWKEGISAPDDAEASLSIEHPSDKESKIILAFHNKSTSFITDSLVISVKVDDEAEEGIHFGTWITAYNNPENFGTFIDYIVSEPDLTVKTEFSSLTLWNPSHRIYQKWCDYLYEVLKFKLDFAEDYKHIDRRMTQSIFERTTVIKQKLDAIEKKIR